MKNNFFFFFLFLINQLLFSQSIERKVLRGRIVVDSFDVENISVVNISSNIVAITDLDGKFSVKAKPTDTLYFKGPSFITKEYVLTQKDFWLEELEIRLYVKVTELNEILITPYTLTGDLNEDTKRIQVYGEGFSKIDMRIKHYEDDVRMGTPINTALPNQFAPAGISFLPLINGLSSLLGIKGNPKKNSERVFEERRIRDLQSKSFSEHILERFSHNFFVETLKIKNEEIPMFMSFSELNVYELSSLLKPENELQLIEYLINKSVEFKLQKAKE